VHEPTSLSTRFATINTHPNSPSFLTHSSHAAREREAYQREEEQQIPNNHKSRKNALLNSFLFSVLYSDIQMHCVSGQKVYTRRPQALRLRPPHALCPLYSKGRPLRSPSHSHRIPRHSPQERSLSNTFPLPASRRPI
jgi:hypothetical protein